MSAHPSPLSLMRGRSRSLRGRPKFLSGLLIGLGLPHRRLGLPLIGLRGRRADVWKYRRTNSPCILQDFVPPSSLWGRCPAYIINNYHYNISEQGKGTDDHLWPLGDWFTLLLYCSGVGQHYELLSGASTEDQSNFNLNHYP